MSGHSKWATTKRAKAVVDAKRGGLFTKHAKNIAIAAKGGGDAELNSTLKSAIEKARTDNMPLANIERAIKKGTGELKDGEEIVEVMYEGYAPEGIAVMVLCQTDNMKRTIQSIRHHFSKNGGNLGEKGCVSYMFKRKGVITFENVTKKEELEMAAINADCEDFEIEDNVVTVYTTPESLMDVKNSLEKDGFTANDFELTFVPGSYIKVENEAKVASVLKFLEALDDDDDVYSVISNFDF